MPSKPQVVYLAFTGVVRLRQKVYSLAKKGASTTAKAPSACTLYRQTTLNRHKGDGHLCGGWGEKPLIHGDVEVLANETHVAALG